MARTGQLMIADVPPRTWRSAARSSGCRRRQRAGGCWSWDDCLLHDVLASSGPSASTTSEASTTTLSMHSASTRRRYGPTRSLSDDPMGEMASPRTGHPVYRGSPGRYTGRPLCFPAGTMICRCRSQCVPTHAVFSPTPHQSMANTRVNIVGCPGS
jgi:hypothetical protein